MFVHVSLLRSLCQAELPGLIAVDVLNGIKSASDICMWWKPDPFLKIFIMLDFLHIQTCSELFMINHEFSFRNNFSNYNLIVLKLCAVVKNWF